MTPLIERNTTIPSSKSQVFSTAADSQPSVEIHVLQGERPMASDNKTLGRFILDGIPPAPRGVPQVEVTFDIDANGILNVSAKDKGTGKEQKITITASSVLSDEEVEKMKKDAELHAEEDKRKRELIEARNMAETLIYTAEKAVADGGDKVSADIKKEVEEKIEVLKKAKETGDLENIKKLTGELSTAAQKIGSAVYSQAGSEAASGEAKAEDVTEGEVEESTTDTKPKDQPEDSK